jgi:hypothetical protein
MGGVHIAEALRIPYFRAFTVSVHFNSLCAAADEVDAMD